METNLPQLNITIDTLTNMVVVEEHYLFTDSLHASLADPSWAAERDRVRRTRGNPGAAERPTEGDRHRTMRPDRRLLA